MDIQYDFTPIGATGEIPGIIAGGMQIKEKQWNFCIVNSKN